MQTHHPPHPPRTRPSFERPIQEIERPIQECMDHFEILDPVCMLRPGLYAPTHFEMVHRPDPVGLSKSTGGKYWACPLHSECPFAFIMPQPVTRAGESTRATHPYSEMAPEFWNGTPHTTPCPGPLSGPAHGLPFT